MELSLTSMESIKILVITAHIKWQIRGFILSIVKCTQEFLILRNDGIEGNMEFVTDLSIYYPTSTEFRTN